MNNFCDHPDWPMGNGGWQESTWAMNNSRPMYYGGNNLETRRIPANGAATNPFANNPPAQNGWSQAPAADPAWGFNQFGLETRRMNQGAVGVNPWAQGKQTMPAQPSWGNMYNNMQFPNGYDSNSPYNWGDTFQSWDNKVSPTWANWMVQPQQMVAPKVDWDKPKCAPCNPAWGVGCGYGYGYNDASYPTGYHTPKNELSWSEEVAKNFSEI